MPKKSISSLELAALVHELQFLVHGKLTNIYHPQDKELLFQIHVANQGKQLLKIIPGKWLCLTQRKETTVKPSSFCMQLRKYLDNAYIKSLIHQDSERIAIFELEKEESFFLIIEFFSKGNVVLTDKNYKIIGVLEQQHWKDRIVKPGEKYLFPPMEVNWETLGEKRLTDILSQSSKRNLATSLATDIGLGGIYAEELCARAGISKDMLPQEVNDAQGKKIIKSLQEMLRLLEKPKGYVYVEQVTPFPLQGAAPLKIMDTYNEAIDALIPFVISSPYEKKIKALEMTIASQEESLAEFHKNVHENTSKGELIYEKYAPLQTLLDIVKELKKKKNWQEIAVELRKEKKIKDVNLKDKRITIDL
ncbi:MAG TPA: NFACT family protein [Candidatus Nanoarchaeia archaeon]|nr:NFACT family protein [Candidatus Nanoarchaeia archaeon]